MVHLSDAGDHFVSVAITSRCDGGRRQALALPRDQHVRIDVMDRDVLQTLVIPVPPDLLAEALRRILR